ncbi:hypothetical protein NDU88_000825 [Pleurodeles waltl]|uniref:Uncharacterized protein n=1 Tax=Pleurodeles waltl TaxID=8319 RepID=A0AAV7SXM5_PLEWA|nr:hypothetical protein NDU88_000825 [Pleurodeles waltl]
MGSPKWSIKSGTAMCVKDVTKAGSRKLGLRSSALLQLEDVGSGEFRPDCFGRFNLLVRHFKKGGPGCRRPQKPEGTREERSGEATSGVEPADGLLLNRPPDPPEHGSPETHSSVIVPTAARACDL